MQIQTKKVVVRGLDDAGRMTSVEGDLVVCPECSGEAFHVYRIGARGHLHLQCVICDVSYCDGSCSEAGATGTGARGGG